MRRARTNLEGYVRLGEILVASGDITPDQLRHAIGRLKGSDGGLGQVLISDGLVSEEQIARAFSLQFDYDLTPFDSFAIDPDATTSVPEELARKHLVVPLRKLGAELHCATADPVDAEALERIEEVSDCMLRPMVATPREIRSEIDRRYGAHDATPRAPLPVQPGSMFLHYRLVAPRWVEPGVVVYEADDTRLLRRVMVAIVKPAVDEDNRRRGQRFLEHSLWLARLPHRGIVTVHDVGESDGLRFVVSEDLHGETIGERLAREHRLSVPAVWDVGLRICEALRHLHRYQIVYQALSPANCVLLGNGEVKLSHLGVRLNPSEHSDHRMVDADEYRYLSPEQLGREPLDCRSDVFALGSLLYEMAVGRPAFPGTSVAAVTEMLREGAALASEELPAALNRVVLRACAGERHARFPDMDALADELRVHPEFASETRTRSAA